MVQTDGITHSDLTHPSDLRGTRMAEREEIIYDIVQEMMMVNDDLRLPRSIWEDLAEAALRVIETPPKTQGQTYLPCTCNNNGYSEHMLDCPMYYG